MTQDKIVHYQTVMFESKMERLKAKAKMQHAKDAIDKAIDHYLACKEIKS